MRRIWDFLIDPRTLSFFGVALIASILLLSAQKRNLALVWMAGTAIVLLLIWATYWLYRRARARRASAALGDMIEQEAKNAVKKAEPEKRADVEALRKRLTTAIRTIRTSKLGETSGHTALYELPWYIVIGNPAAGKSSAIVNSGLKFPFAESTGNIIQGIGGTRNCDWFFTSEGILLDTAGRYSVHEEDRNEWLGFLGLLKKHRPKAPINGIIIAASIAELTSSRPEHAITLAKQLRQRIQELVNQLEVIPPVYVLFTKADLIAGFVEFFEDTDLAERERVWGASLSYDMDGKADAMKRFDEHFDFLHEGLKELATTRMGMSRGQRMPPGLLTFPIEFAGLRPALRSFIATLFEDNPFQFKPIFRGFYFSSAVQEGRSVTSSNERIAERFGLKLKRASEASTGFSGTGFFLRKLFSRVIFADKNLVKQYTSRKKLQFRYVAFFAAVTLFGLVLGGWTWSYVGNRQLIANIEADLQKLIRLQENRVDLQPRIEALETLQDRIEQLQRYRTDRPLAISLGLYQGDLLENKLRTEYYAGVREVMLKPVAASLEAFLAEVNSHADALSPMTRPPRFSGSTNETSAASKPVAGEYTDVSATSTADAYNALKTYLMLAERDHLDAGHLSDQLTRFWRSWLETNRGNMPREQMIRSAERLISFYLMQVNDPDFPLIESKLTLVDQSRETLRRVVRGMPARERVYAEIKARASTRFAPMTVARILGDSDKDVMAGSYAIPGTFTREAWEQYVEGAVKDAANKELQSADWVLKTAARDDLTLEGSPEQIQKGLTQSYKEEYVREWQKFLQGVAIPEFHSFEQAVPRLNRLGDPANSPISKLMTALYEQTSWDNPSLLNAGLQKAQRGVIDWFRETILRQAPSQVNVNVNVSAKAAEIPTGPIGKEFAGVAKLMVAHGDNKDASLMRGYLEGLSKIRTRFNQMRTQGDPGPASRQLMQQTLDASGSELADALRYVDEQMLTGMNDTQRGAIRPLLVRPLMQAYAVIVKPAEEELNKTWSAQVYEPFSKTVGAKYPFAVDSRIEASTTEIAQIFGPDAAIAKYVQSTMGPLVIRRGDTVAARTWADMGIHLSPDFSVNFARWVAPLSAGGAPSSSASGSDAQTVFQIQPLPTPGLVEYSIEIDGQVLRYRNAQSEWTNFVWPNSQGRPGVKVSGVTYDGRTVELVNQPGRFGLERLISSAQREKREGGVFKLTWTAGQATVAINLRIVSSPSTNVTANGDAGASAPTTTLRGMKLPARVAGEMTMVTGALQ